MPFVDTVTTDWSHFQGKQRNTKLINVSNSVGIGGKNDVGDVLAVQVMFFFIGVYRETTKINVNPPLPPPNGKYTKELGYVIYKYQKYYSFFCLSADGVIHPGAYKDRVLHAEKHKVMTIQQLNQHCENTALALGYGNQGDYIQVIRQMYPELKVWI